MLQYIHKFTRYPALVLICQNAFFFVYSKFSEIWNISFRFWQFWLHLTNSNPQVVSHHVNLGLYRTRFNLAQRQNSGSRFPQRQDNNVRFPAERPQPSPASDKNGGLLGTVLGLLRPQNRPQTSAPGKSLFIFWEISLGSFHFFSFLARLIKVNFMLSH